MHLKYIIGLLLYRDAVFQQDLQYIRLQKPWKVFLSFRALPYEQYINLKILEGGALDRLFPDTVEWIMWWLHIVTRQVLCNLS